MSEDNNYEAFESSNSVLAKITHNKIVTNFLNYWNVGTTWFAGKVKPVIQYGWVPFVVYLGMRSDSRLTLASVVFPIFFDSGLEAAE
jgi:hypothetical protein